MFPSNYLSYVRPEKEKLSPFLLLQNSLVFLRRLNADIQFCSLDGNEHQQREGQILLILLKTAHPLPKSYRVEHRFLE